MTPSFPTGLYSELLLISWLNWPCRNEAASAPLISMTARSESEVAKNEELMVDDSLTGPEQNTSVHDNSLVCCASACSRFLPPPASWMRSEEHTSELQSLMRTSYAVF